MSTTSLTVCAACQRSSQSNSNSKAAGARRRTTLPLSEVHAEGQPLFRPSIPKMLLGEHLEGEKNILPDKNPVSARFFLFGKRKSFMGRLRTLLATPPRQTERQNRCKSGSRLGKGRNESFYSEGLT